VALHVIVGAGVIGSTTARQLADAGERVRIITRSGGGPEHPAIERVAADATDADRLTELTRTAATIYNCASPLYHQWTERWPPLATAMLTAAERTGAGYVLTCNLYGYGKVDGSMTEGLPMNPMTVKGGVRARMWHEALAAHAAGKVRVTEVRASDFVGRDARSVFGQMVAPKVVAGKAALVPVPLDVPHSWTYTGDVARTLIAAGRDDRSWGRAWHAPTNPPGTIRELSVRLARLAGVAEPKLRRMPYPVVWMGGLFDPIAKEFREMAYQFDKPFILDSSLSEKTFGLAPTPLDEALREMI